MHQVPMCWKCRDALTELDPKTGGYVLVGCAADININDYNDAKERCPLLEAPL